MLLTSSQVSVAVSSGVVILCTTALFFSGYAIQQRTLRDLRRSIREPRPEPPKIFLPDRFKKETTELPDGRVVEVDDNMPHGYGSQLSPDVVEVRPSVSGGEDGRKQQTINRAQDSGTEDTDATDSFDGGKSMQQLVVESGQGRKALGREVSSQEQDNMDSAQNEISRAERRRLIKEELRRLAYSDKPLYYQRRLY